MRSLCTIGFALCVASSAHALSPQAQRGRAAMKKAQCNRCHAISDLSGQNRGLASANRDVNCVGCHTWILGTKGKPAEIRKYRAQYPDWDRYLRNIEHYTALPDLGTITRRVRPEFVRSFLDAPHDLRPNLDESMIPVLLSNREKDDVVAYLAELSGNAVAKDESPDDRARPSSDQIALGRQLFQEKGCVTCHVVGNERFGASYDAKFYRSMRPDALLAPNLRFARDRIPRSVLVRHMVDPTSIDPKSRMPKGETTPAQAERIADFLLHGDIDAKLVKQPRAPEIPLLKRTVQYDEVNDKIFGRICVHCHMDPASNQGDGGPGNTGGIGYRGAKLNLETYDGIKSGLSRFGKRVSVLEPERPGEPPLLLKSVLRRHEEAARDVRGPFEDGPVTGPGANAQRPGMPLGLPPLDVEDLSLIKTWLAQGAPGPR